MIEKGGVPARCSVRLHFAEPDETNAGRRAFKVFIQDKPVLVDFDIVAAAGGARRAVVREFKGVEVTGSLKIRMSLTKQSLKPILCAFEAIRGVSP